MSSASSFTVDDDVAAATGDTIIKTTAGDLIVDWGQEQGTGTLTLDSADNIYVREPILIDSGGNLSLTSGDGGSGHLVFQGGNASFADLASALTIDGAAYTLVNDIATLATDIAGNAGGNYALANPYDASGDGTYAHSPIPTTFTGNFEGLGNTIGNLTINSADTNVGFFADIGSGGLVENLDLLNLSVTGTGHNASVGGMAGFNQGTMLASYAAGSVDGSRGNGASVGGYVGYNSGVIDGSGFSGNVSGDIAGGFIGFQDSSGSILDSYSLGTVTTAFHGAGFASTVIGGSIDNSYTTDAVFGSAGATIAGFALENIGTISDSYTAGTLTGPANSAGFAYYNFGTINTSAWDKDTTQDHGTGVGMGGSTGLAGLTAANAFTQATYATLGWTFGAGGDWFMIDGSTRPFLQSEFSTYITNAHQLQLMDMDLLASYALANDVTYDGTMWSSAGFSPVGGFSSPFEGTFDGQGYAIHNLYIDRPTTEAVGLFGYACGCTIISNLTLDGGSVTGLGTVGALAGFDGGEIDHVSSSVAVAGFTDIGGLVGEFDGLMFGSSSSGNVTGQSEPGTSGAPGWIGGLIGQMDAGLVESSFATGTVTALGGIYVGVLIGTVVSNNGAAIDMSYATGEVNAGADSSGNTGFAVGGLIGDNGGQVTDSFATGAVIGGQIVGGLIGFNENDAPGTDQNNPTGDGTVVGSFATGAVTGDLNSSNLGGLIGYNNGGVANSYATGTVTGGDQLGGLIGGNIGSLRSVYSTGRVLAASGASPTELGGLIGEDDSFDVQNAYWDIQTSGIGIHQGAGNFPDESGMAGETTFQLQHALPAGFSSADWAILPGVSYPYLQWQFNGTPEVVSGKVYAANGLTTLAGLPIGLFIDGFGVIPAVDMISGANGYYYLLLAPGTISGSGSNVFAYLASGTPGNTYVQDAMGSILGAAIQQGGLRILSGATDSNAILAGMNAALGSVGGGQFLYSSAGGFVSGQRLVINDTAASFTLDSSIDIGNGLLMLNTAGSDTQTSGIITAGSLTGKSNGGASFTDANAIAKLGSFTNVGAGGFALTDARSLSIGGVLNAGSDDVALTTTGAGHNIAITQKIIAGGTVTLTSAGNIRESQATGIIQAGALTGSAASFAQFQGANLIATLSDFTTGSLFSLTDGETLNVTGNVGSGIHALTLDVTSGDLDIAGSLTGGKVTLASASGAVQGAGVIDANVLNVTANTGIDLTGANHIKKIGVNHTNSGSDIINP